MRAVSFYGVIGSTSDRTALPRALELIIRHILHYAPVNSFSRSFCSRSARTRCLESSKLVHCPFRNVRNTRNTRVTFRDSFFSPFSREERERREKNKRNAFTERTKQNTFSRSLNVAWPVGRDTISETRLHAAVR